jgi:hypothetical protein
VNITLDRDTTRIAEVFKNAQKEDIRGFFKLVGWELRQSGNVHIFHNPTRNSYFAISGDAQNLNIRYYMPENEHNYSRLKIASTDALMATDTPSIIATGSVIEQDGQSIFINAPSKSGKTTLMAQLINAKFKFRLVSEDRVLINNQGAFSMLSHEGYVRKEALPYLGLPGDADKSVDFRNYVGVLNNVPKIDVVLVPEFNLNGHYEVKLDTL